MARWYLTAGAGVAGLLAAVVPLIFQGSTTPGLLAHHPVASKSIADRNRPASLSSDVRDGRAKVARTKGALKPAAVTTAPVTANGKPLGTFVVTCYDLSGTTASGAQVGPQTVAVDPSVIPLGSSLYVDGVGARIAQDTGAVILGRRLDVWAPSESQCLTWGVQSRQVWLLWR